MKITNLQKKIVLSTFGFILGSRAIRYTYLKYIPNIWGNGNYFEWTSMLNISVFIMGIIAFFASIIGFMSIVREILQDKRKEVVSERFIRLFINSFWTLVVSIVLAMIVKVLIWP
ncbi:MAG: hypothetical protein WCI72_00615 [archaeon]